MSGDNELASLDFQKRYRLPVVHLLDPAREFEKQHNQDGWPFLIVADQTGHIIHRQNSPLSRDMPRMKPIIGELWRGQPPVKLSRINGIEYMPATMQRTGEMLKVRTCERFSSLACGADGKVYVVFTRARHNNSDVFMRIYDGGVWCKKDAPIAASEADEYDGSVAIDNRGRVWVSWTSNAHEEKYNIFVASFASPLESVQAEPVTDADDDAVHGRIACASDGNVYLTYYKWQKIGQNSRDREIYLRRWSQGTWPTEIQISPRDVSECEDHSDPSLVPYGDGVLVWWSWDYHQPERYTQEAREPTVFVRAVDRNLMPGQSIVVSGKRVDITPVVVHSRGRTWCAYSSQFRLSEPDRYRKTLALTTVEVNENTVAAKPQRYFGNPTSNVCTPAFAMSLTGWLTLLWSEKQGNSRWVLRRSDLEPNGHSWSYPQMVEPDGNPRFCSGAYDPQGQLWVSYSVETDEGIKLVARKLPQRGEETRRPWSHASPLGPSISGRVLMKSG